MRDAAYGASVALAQEKEPSLSSRPSNICKAALPNACPRICAQPSKARPAQQPSAVHRTHGHGVPGLCRQRLQRYRATFSWTYTRKNARPTAANSSIPSKTMPTGFTDPCMVMRRAARLFRQRARNERQRACGHDALRAAVYRHFDLQDCQYPGRLSIRGLQEPLHGMLGSWTQGCATYRPNDTLGAVLSTESTKIPHNLLTSILKQLSIQQVAQA